MANQGVNMSTKNLRKIIRSILQENLGKKLFAPSAPVGHPHHGDEINTPEEDQLKDEIWSYIRLNTDSLIKSDFQKRYIEYAKNPLYSDILQVMPAGIQLFRGMKVPKEQLELQIFGIDEDADDEIPAGALTPGQTYGILANTEYEHMDWRTQANQMMSSWTTDAETAINFSKGIETKQQSFATVPVVFVAHTGGMNAERFLDFRNLYDYKGLEARRDEQEIVGWDIIELTAISVGNF